MCQLLTPSTCRRCFCCLAARVVWVATQKVGCAIQFCPLLTNKPPNSFLVVCRYSPAGNVAGQFNANVRPLVT